VQPDDLAGRDLLHGIGFRLTGTTGGGELVWQRTPPRRRNAGSERFIDGAGRIDRYPLRTEDRRRLLIWVAERVLPHGEVWSEPQVNDRLARVAPGGDVAVLRRYLVDADLLERTRSGSTYARVAE